MRRLVALGLVGAAVFAPIGVAWAATRQASIGNYYYEDDATGSRTQIVVAQGDQVRFTVREGVYPPHTVDVDELNIHSPGLLLGETFTTPPLDRPGTFRVYCRPHEDRGHVSKLVVRAAAVTPPPATPVGTAATTAPAVGGGSATTPAASTPPTSSPAASLAPVGVGRASAQELDRPRAVDPDSLEGLTGRARSTQPWTRAVWLLLIATVPIIGAAGFAVSREVARGTSPLSADPARSPARSRRGSAQKASGSGRTSRDRRR